MTVQYWGGLNPGGDDNSLSKPSVSLFLSMYQNNTNDWNDVKGAVANNMTYQRATLNVPCQYINSNPINYGRICLDSNNTQWFYFFTDGIEFQGLSEDGTSTVELRLDKWGTIMGVLNTNLMNQGTTQVLASNKEVNLYDYGNSAYTNESSFMGLKDVYPQFKNVQTIKYNATNQICAHQSTVTIYAQPKTSVLPVFRSNDPNSNSWIDPNNNVLYYYSKIAYQTTAMFKNTQPGNNSATVSLPFNVGYTNSNDNNVPSFSPFICFSPVVPLNTTGATANFSNTYSDGINILNGGKGCIPTLLACSSEKDIALVQLPFDVSTNAVSNAEEYLITQNKALAGVQEGESNGVPLYDPNQIQIQTSDDRGMSGVAPFSTTKLLGPTEVNAGDNATLKCPECYFMSVNGTNIGNLEDSVEGQYTYYGTGGDGGCGWGNFTNRAIDSFVFSNLANFGFQSCLNYISGFSTHDLDNAYCISLPVLMCPMLASFVSEHIAYMGQDIHYDRSFVNNVLYLFQPYYTSYPGALPEGELVNSVNTYKNGGGDSSLGEPAHKLVFTANYPNLTLNGYANQNIKGAPTQPIGQINLTTAMLPNTTNPDVSFITNEAKIINNAGTLKNLDIGKDIAGLFGGIGLEDIFNPMGFVKNLADSVMNIEGANLSYSDSFGNAKQYSLAKSNKLQTAGDNLGAPDNILVSYGLVPAVNTVQNVMGYVDKYGYPYNQGDTFNNLFANYYHNYIKITQNADYLVYQNAPQLLKEGQSYLIKQLQNGVIIWEHGFGEDSIFDFMNVGQYAQDMMNGASNFFNPGAYDSNYHMNFKNAYTQSTLINLTPAMNPTYTAIKSTNPSGGSTTKVVNPKKPSLQPTKSTPITSPAPKPKQKLYKLVNGDDVSNGESYIVGEITFSDSTNTKVEQIVSGTDCLIFHEYQDSYSSLGFTQGTFSATSYDEFFDTNGNTYLWNEESYLPNGASEEVNVNGGGATGNQIKLANWEAGLGTIFGSGTGTNPPKTILTGAEAQTGYDNNVNTTPSNAFVLSNEIKVGGINTHAKQQNPTNQKETPKNKTRKVVL